MMFNDRRNAALPSLESLTQKYGTNLPGATRKKPRRTAADWEARASVLAAGRSGAIKATKKSPSKLSQKLGGMIMGTGSSNKQTLKENRAAIDSELNNAPKKVKKGKYYDKKGK